MNRPADLSLWAGESSGGACPPRMGLLGGGVYTDSTSQVLQKVSPEQLRQFPFRHIFAATWSYGTLVCGTVIRVRRKSGVFGSDPPAVNRVR